MQMDLWFFCFCSREALIEVNTKDATESRDQPFAQIGQREIRTGFSMGDPPHLRKITSGCRFPYLEIPVWTPSRSHQIASYWRFVWHSVKTLITIKKIQDSPSPLPLTFLNLSMFSAWFCQQLIRNSQKVIAFQMMIRARNYNASLELRKT